VPVLSVFSTKYVRVGLEFSQKTSASTQSSGFRHLIVAFEGMVRICDYELNLLDEILVPTSPC
jgi:hypothetical protein